MKTLIVYYSRTQTTKRIAEMIQRELDCDIEEITDSKKYKGKLGFIKGGMNATMGRTSDINPVTKNPSDYDLVIIGTPVWSSNMVPPIHTYLLTYNDQIKNMASFCTCMGGGYDKALKKIAEVSGKTQLSTMFLTSKEIEKPEALSKS